MEPGPRGFLTKAGRAFNLSAPRGGVRGAGVKPGSCNSARCEKPAEQQRALMPKQDQDSNWGYMAGVGLQMLVGVGLGYLVGSWLDGKYGWGPWGVIIGSMLGLAGGMYLLIKDAIRINKD
jgi:F0F1-type ATP synthase assembly protein I